MKTRSLKGAVLKIDLSKAYDRVSWLYIRLLLTHLGFDVPFINWVMNCLTSTSFAFLINGSTSSFFSSERGLRQGCPLSPLLFLLVAEGLNRAISQAKSAWHFLWNQNFTCSVSHSPSLHGRCFNLQWRIQKGG
jgi:hypothetical protein